MHAITVEETNEATVERVIKIPRESAANEEAGRQLMAAKLQGQMKVLASREAAGGNITEAHRRTPEAE